MRVPLGVSLTKASSSLAPVRDKHDITKSQKRHACVKSVFYKTLFELEII